MLDMKLLKHLTGSGHDEPANRTTAEHLSPPSPPPPAPSISSLLSFVMLPLPDNEVAVQLQRLADQCRHGNNYCKQVLSLHQLSKVPAGPAHTAHAGVSTAGLSVFCPSVPSRSCSAPSVRSAGRNLARFWRSCCCRTSRSASGRLRPSSKLRVSLQTPWPSWSPPLWSRRCWPPARSCSPVRSEPLQSAWVLYCIL